MPDKPKKESPGQKRAKTQAEREEWSQERIDQAFAASGGIPKGTNPEEPPSRGPGRPSKYHTIDLERVQALAAGGLTKLEIAGQCGIAYDTLREYEKDYPAFSEAINRGRAREVEDVISALHANAKGHYAPVEKLQYDTQVGKWVRESTLQYYPPDTKAQHIILQHAETGSWKPKADVEMKFPEALVLKSLATGAAIETLGVEAPPKE